jgi:hypothetical protein
VIKGDLTKFNRNEETEVEVAAQGEIGVAVNVKVIGNPF